ncbi:PAS domain-containing protein [Sphingopyxis sp. PAMC25046]|uniref:PAS domain-containing sensor histidine kinase n=1 Tax=Sphingopyxis sp. PAMC25046 TaxID=2565556 RepID=UPI00109E2FD8|nr:ATP-binding protein [Sphingopyxis sp. PAMC25046]QCB54532.1 PAS domain-containing protein [Sphingopyxis sp. PAMC25046]
MTALASPAALAADDPGSELASESVILFDMAGRVRYWNPAAEILFGWPPLAMVGRTLDHLMPPEDAGGGWQQLLQEGRWQGIVHRRSPAGAYVGAAVRQHVRYHDDGTPRDIVEYGMGVSDGKRPGYPDDQVDDARLAATWEIDISGARAAIASVAGQQVALEPAELDTRLRAVVHAARIVAVNDRTARLVGGNRGRGLMVGQSVADFWPVGSRATLGELIVEAAGCETGDAVHRRSLASDGILRDPTLSVWRGGSDAPPERLFVAVNGAADDDRSYPYLRASEARYRKLIHFMPVALWQVDASRMGKIYAELRARGVTDFERYLEEHPELVELAATTVPVTDVNRSAIQLIGGSNVQDLIQPVGYLFAISRESLRRVMIGRFSGRQNYSEFMKVRRLDGLILDVRFSVTYPEPLLELDTTIFSLEDVTDRLRMESQLRQIQADFSHAARISTLGELTSSIAHEVNQPLAAIMTNAETSLRWLVRPDVDLAKVRQLTERIAASARRADDIVGRIRGMAAKQPPELVPLNLNEVVQESLLFVRHEVDTRAIRVTASYAKGLTPVIADRIQLQQVVVNLLINAIQAVEAQRESDREIALATGSDTDGAIWFRLRDSGPGVAPDHLGRIFEGFFTTKEGGMGIGLAICHSIVGAHGGSITVENRPGGGAEFRVALPGEARAARANQAADGTARRRFKAKPAQA